MIQEDKYFDNEDIERMSKYTVENQNRIDLEELEMIAKELSVQNKDNSIDWDSLEMLAKQLKEERQLDVFNLRDSIERYSDIIFARDDANEYSIKVISLLQKDNSIDGLWLSLSQEYSDTIQTFSHPHILKCHRSFQIGNYFLIQMDKFEMSLQEWFDLMMNKAVMNQLFLNKLAQILQTLQHLLSRNFVAKSLSFNNIYLDKDGNVKIYQIRLANQFNLVFGETEFQNTLKEIEQFFLPQEIYKQIQQNQMIEVNGEAVIENNDIIQILFQMIESNGKQREQLQMMIKIFTYLFAVYEIFETIQYPSRMRGIYILQMKCDKNEEQQFEVFKCRYDQMYQQQLAKQLGDILQTSQLSYVYLAVIAQIYLKAQFFELAIVWANQSIKIKITELGYLIKGAANKKLHQQFLAVMNYESAFDVHQNNDQIAYTLGRIQKNNFQESYKHYKKAIEINPQNEKALYELGKGHSLKEQYDQSIEYLKRALEIDPQNFKILQNLGDIFYKQNSYNEAIEYFKKALELQPNNEKILASLGIIYQDQLMTEESNAYYSQIDKALPLQFIFNKIGYNYMIDKQNNLALFYLKKSAMIDPNNYKSYFNLGNIYSSFNMNQQAIQNFQKAMELKSDDYSVVRNLAFAYKNEGMYKEAIECCKECIKYEDQDDMFELIGDIYKLMGRFEESITYFKLYLELAPDDDETVLQIALMYEDKKMFNESAQYYKKYLELKPYQNVVINSLGKNYRELDMKDKAIECFKRAFEVDDTNHTSLSYLGETYASQLMFKEAIHYFKMAIKIDDYEGDAHCLLGNVYRDLFLYEKALNHYSKSIKINSCYRQAYYEIGITFQMLDLYNEAIAYFQKSIIHVFGFSSPLSNIQIGNILCAQQKYAQAIQQYNQVEKQNKIVANNIIICQKLMNK